MDSDLITETYAARLRAAGLRVTQPRLAILEVLHRTNEPITIEKLHESLSRADCDLVTVYRCMDAFEAIGLVKRFFLRSGTTAFTTERAGKDLFVMSIGECHPAEVSPDLTNSLKEATATVERHLERLGYSDVRGVVEFFAEPPAKS